MVPSCLHAHLLRCITRNAGDCEANTVWRLLRPSNRAERACSARVDSWPVPLYNLSFPAVEAPYSMATVFYS